MVHRDSSFFLTMGFAAVFATIVTLLLPLAQTVYAVDYVVSNEASCESLPVSGGPVTWDASTSTCTIDGELALLVSDTLTIPSAVTLEVSATGSINPDFEPPFNQGGTINNNGVINNNGDITYIDTLNNYGTYNDYESVHEESYTLNNYDTFNNYGNYVSFGSLFNFGTINDYGTLSNVSVSLSFINYPDGVINIFGSLLVNHILNQGIINNDNTFYSFELSGNSGTIYNNDIFNIDFYFDNSGTIYNTGTMTNVNSLLDTFNFAILTNSGTIQNYNTFSNSIDGIADNLGTFINHCGSTFINLGTFSGNQPINIDCATSFAINESGKAKVTVNGNSQPQKRIALQVTGDITCGTDDVLRIVPNTLKGVLKIAGVSHQLSPSTISVIGRDSTDIVTIRATTVDGITVNARLGFADLPDCNIDTGTELVSESRSLTASRGNTVFTLIARGSAGDIQFN